MRIGSLDSLRGVAALIVVLHHITVMLPPVPALTKYSPLRVLFAGEQAVFVFFILSGFVLFLAIGKKVDARSILPFCLKRICRIYLPFVVAIMLSAALWHLIQPQPIPELTSFFNSDCWGVVPTWSLIAGHLEMTNVPSLRSLDQVMWSLVVELRISLIFPALAALVLWNWRVAFAGSLVFSELCFIAHHSGYSLGRFDLIHTGMFCYLFVGGATLALHINAIRQRLHVGSMAGVLLWAVALFLFSVSPERFGSLLTGVGASLILVLSLNETWVSRLLDAPPLVWLGRVSYSLYLIHLPIMLATAHLLYGLVPPSISLPIGVLATMALSEIMYRCVEVPSISAGRSTARLLMRAFAPPQADQPSPAVGRGL
jgi:peptidoglycan/LPS O-acetylase OafA/YrhL